MGKVLIIKGLVVSNPVDRVTIEGSYPSVLSSYYRRNKSITYNQTESLNKLVKTLIDNGLWDKLYYFYPFLGSTIEDMTLECTDTENEDLFALGGTGGLTVDENFLIIDSTRSKGIIYPTSATLISPSNVSFIMATANPYIQTPIFMDANNGVKRISLRTYSAGGAPMAMDCGYNESNTTSTITGDNLGTSILERVVCGTINNGNGVIWNDKTKYTEGIGNTDFIIGRVGNVFTSFGNVEGKLAFFAMAQYMTEAEWGKFYDALLIFLKETGKHS